MNLAIGVPTEGSHVGHSWESIATVYWTYGHNKRIRPMLTSRFIVNTLTLQLPIPQMYIYIYIYIYIAVPASILSPPAWTQNQTSNMYSFNSLGKWWCHIICRWRYDVILNIRREIPKAHSTLSVNDSNSRGYYFQLFTASASAIALTQFVISYCALNCCIMQ